MTLLDGTTAPFYSQRYQRHTAFAVDSLYISTMNVNFFFHSQKTVREGAVDSQRGGEACIELFKDPEFGIK